MERFRQRPNLAPVDSGGGQEQQKPPMPISEVVRRGRKAGNTLYKDFANKEPASKDGVTSKAIELLSERVPPIPERRTPGGEGNRTT